MLDLFRSYDLSQIIIFVVMLIFAIKGGWDLVDYFKKKYTEKFNKDFAAKEAENKLENHYINCSNQHVEALGMYNELSDQVNDLTQEVHERFDKLEQSDMHQIKHDIVKDYHYFIDEKGWIDDFNLDCLELIYQDYKREGGNSYIDGLMEELRRLPKHPPQD